MAAHRYWRIYITASDGGTYVSLAEVELRSSIGGADLIGSGSVSASYSNPSYPVSNSIDNNASTFWTTYTQTPPQWWKYDFGEGNAYDIVEVALTPRGGAYYHESPRNFTIDYSDNGTDWTTARSFQSHYWPNTNQQLFLIQSDFAPHDLTSDTSHSPFVVSYSSYASNPNRGFAAFDWNSWAWWAGTGSGTDWLQLDLGSGNSKILQMYEIVAFVDAGWNATMMPNTWTLKGSNNGSDWDTLDTVSGQSGWAQGERRRFTCDTITTAYRYFRINITANNGHATYTTISELYLYESPPSITGTSTLSYLFSLLSDGYISPTGTSNLTYLFSLLAEGYLPITASGDISYTISLAAEGYLPITGDAALSYLYSLLSEGYISPTGSGDLTYTYQLSASGQELFIASGGLTYQIRLSGSGRFINSTGGLIFTFSQAGSGTVVYNIAQLVYLMSLAGNAKLEIIGSGSLGPFTFQMSGEGYMHNINFDYEEYLRRYINDPFGLMVDQSPITPTYEEIPDELVEAAPD